MIEKEIHDFDIDFTFGEIGEKLFEDTILPRLEDKWGKINNKEGQHHSGDFKGEKNNYEIKTRKMDYGDLLIEMGHSNDMLGWIEKYGEKTFLVYQILEFKEGSLTIKYPLFMFKPFELKSHASWLNRFKKKKSINNNYTTYFIAIPMEKLASKVEFFSITKDKIIKWKNKI